ncbi:MAG: RNase H family protein [Sulfurospirillaceae bacterium]|nr:RNase H family protein [Sulfurospirillaceae bacterium]
MKQKQFLFTDGSVDPRKNIGFGAYLLVSEDDDYDISLKQNIKIKKFEVTSSTKLEIETLLWALKEIHPQVGALVVFTDCQNILGLHARREKLEAHDYMTSKNKKIANHELYREFYKITDTLKCRFMKVKGHKPKDDKDDIDKFFTLVDRASRNALRDYSGVT